MDTAIIAVTYSSILLLRSVHLCQFAAVCGACASVCASRARNGHFCSGRLSVPSMLWTAAPHAEAVCTQSTSDRCMRTARPSCGNVFGRGNASTISSIPMCVCRPRHNRMRLSPLTVRVVNRLLLFCLPSARRAAAHALCCVAEGHCRARAGCAAVVTVLHGSRSYVREPTSPCATYPLSPGRLFPCGHDGRVGHAGSTQARRCF